MALSTATGIKTESPLISLKDNTDLGNCNKREDSVVGAFRFIFFTPKNLGTHADKTRQT